MSNPHIRHFEVPSRMRLDEAIQSEIQSMTAERSHYLIQLGAIYVDGYRMMESRVLKPGQVVRVHLDPRRYPADSVDWSTAILDQTRDFLIVNKPRGLPVHPSLDNAKENVLACLSRHLNQELFITQRLDVGTGGLFCIAKTKEFQRLFNKWLADRRIDKFYFALSTRPLPTGRLIHYMLPGDRAPRIVQVQPVEGFAECQLEILSVVEHGDYFGHHIHLLTGRTHQIRTQFAHEGAPLLGDVLYSNIYEQLHRGRSVENLEKPDPRKIVDERFGLWCTDLRFDGREWKLPAGFA